MNGKFSRKNFKNGPCVKFRPSMHFVRFSQLIFTWFRIPLPRVTIPVLVVKLRHEIWPVTHSMYMRSCSVHPLDVPGDRNRHPSTLSRRWFGPPLTPSTGVKIQHRRPIFRNSTLKERTFHSIVLTGKEIWYCSLLHLIRSEHKEIFSGTRVPDVLLENGVEFWFVTASFWFWTATRKKEPTHMIR